MNTLLHCLYNLLTHITEDHIFEVPLELAPMMNKFTNALGEWLDKNG